MCAFYIRQHEIKSAIHLDHLYTRACLEEKKQGAATSGNYLSFNSVIHASLAFSLMYSNLYFFNQVINAAFTLEGQRGLEAALKISGLSGGGERSSGTGVRIEVHEDSKYRLTPHHSRVAFLRQFLRPNDGRNRSLVQDSTTKPLAPKAGNLGHFNTGFQMP